MPGIIAVGRREEIRCVADVAIGGSHGEPLCLAHKTTSHYAGLGVYVSDDGYVLGVPSASETYYPVTAEQLRTYQAEGALSTPLPHYLIPWTAYAKGYSLWLLVAFSLAWTVSDARVRRRRAERWTAERARAPRDSAKPTLRTKADQFIHDELRPLLRGGETVLQQAYVFDRDASTSGMIGALFARGMFAALTTERVLLVKVGLAAFGLRLINRGVETIERSATASVASDADLVTLVHVGGNETHLRVAATDALSNQAAFMKHAPSILANERTRHDQRDERKAEAPTQEVSHEDCVITTHRRAASPRTRRPRRGDAAR